MDAVTTGFVLCQQVRAILLDNLQHGYVSLLDIDIVVTDVEIRAQSKRPERHASLRKWLLDVVPRVDNFLDFRLIQVPDGIQELVDFLDSYLLIFGQFELGLALFLLFFIDL